jgi:hypothetical protein
MLFGFDDGWAEAPRIDWTSAPTAPSWSKAKDSVDGEKKGPVINEQPGELQPNAAGPTNVGLKLPRVVEVMPPFPPSSEAVGLAIACPAETSMKATANSNGKITAEIRTKRGFMYNI